MMNILSVKPGRGSTWITLDKASPEGCGRGTGTTTHQTTVPQGLNIYGTEVQPLRGCLIECGSVDSVTAPLRGCFVNGLTILRPSGTSDV